MSTEHVLFQLLRQALGLEGLVSIPSNADWDDVIRLAERHGLSAIAWDGFQSIFRENPQLEFPLDKPRRYEWFGAVLQCEIRNATVNERCRELYDLYTSHGMACCVLKGQGVGQLYPVPNHRTSGDIDIWVLGGMDEVLRVTRDIGAKVSRINVKHVDADLFEDVQVEVHFNPGYFYNPIVSHRFRLWYERYAAEQCGHFDESLGFSFPTISFNLVYLMYHLFQHYLYEGVGLRQVTDYCCALMHSDEVARRKAFEVVKNLRMTRFCGGLMWVMSEVYGLSHDALLCEPEEGEGRFMLEEFMRGAAFGRFDERNRRGKVGVSGRGGRGGKSLGRERIADGLSHLRRGFRFFTRYPAEVLCAPFWKLWHWAWRARRGYLG